MQMRRWQPNTGIFTASKTGRERPNWNDDVEYYGNTLTNTSAIAGLNHRGGWGLFFNNIMTGRQVGGLRSNQYAAG